MFQVVKSKAGWVVQNTKTYGIAGGPYATKEQADAIAAKLNK